MDSVRGGSVRGGLLAHARAKQATFEATITRADGTVENLGVVSYWHRNPLKRWLWAFQQWRKKGAR